MPCKNCIESWEQRNFVRDGEHAQSAPVAAPRGHWQEFPRSPVRFGSLAIASSLASHRQGRRNLAGQACLAVSCLRRARRAPGVLVSAPGVER